MLWKGIEKTNLPRSQKKTAIETRIRRRNPGLHRVFWPWKQNHRGSRFQSSRNKGCYESRNESTKKKNTYSLKLWYLWFLFSRQDWGFRMCCQDACFAIGPEIRWCCPPHKKIQPGQKPPRGWWWRRCFYTNLKILGEKDLKNDFDVLII